jgi:chromosome segregation ATPase
MTSTGDLDTTEPGTGRRKKASLQDLVQRNAYLEVQLALAQPDQALQAMRELKKAHLRIRNLRYHLDQIERSVTRLKARIPDSELASLQTYCRETLEKEPAPDEEETEKLPQHAAMQARLILDQEAEITALRAENTRLREQNAELESERDQAQAALTRQHREARRKRRSKNTAQDSLHPLELWSQDSEECLRKHYENE